MFFSVFFVVVHFSTWIGGWVEGVRTIRVFLGFLDLFNLTSPLSHDYKIIVAAGSRLTGL